MTSFTRYPRGSIIGFIGAVIGFVAGQYWQFADFRIKSRAVEIEQIRATIEQVRAEKELYERLQLLQHQASDAIPRYLVLRDKHFAAPKKLSEAERYELQNAYQAEKAKLVGLIREYNQLEAKLSRMEVRQPRFFVLPIPPMAPKNFRIEGLGPGAVFKWDPGEPDPVRVEVEKETIPAR